MRVSTLVAIVLLSATIEASALDYTRDGKTYDVPAVVAFWEFNVIQSNGVIFPKELLAELAINLEHVGHGRKYVLTYSCRFAGVTIKIIPDACLATDGSDVAYLGPCRAGP